MPNNSAGFSSSRLDLMHRVLQGHIDRGEIPGLVALVSRNDDVHVETLGKQALDSAAPMKRDSIFRIASISKPVTAVAAMILMEECRLSLDDSIEKWIPEMANRRVLNSIESELDDTVPAIRPISVRDLLTFRMGFGSVMARPGTYPIQEKIREYRLGGDGPPMPSLGPTTDEWLNGLASLPLMAQPGERWMYNTSSDLLGVLISRVSGQSFGAFLHDRIFEPLGMKDTAFHVAPGKINRLSVTYSLNRKTNNFTVYDGVADSSWLPEPPFESGAGGLVSTVDDYFAFSRMMLNNGSLGDTRILSRASVGLMTSDHLTADQRLGAGPFFGDFSSWGFGVAVDIRRKEIFNTPGRYGWTGGLGTSAYTDPAENLIAIIFTQRLMDSPEPPKVFSDFFTLAYSAME